MSWLDKITFEDADTWRREFGTPCFLYDESALRAAAEAAKAFPAAYGLTVRYAMKAAPNANLLRCFRDWGLSFDASSLYEALRLEAAGVPLERVSLSSQQLDAGFADLHRRGMAVNACSLDQLRRFGEAFPDGRVGLRFNPGLGSGGTNRTNVGGPASSFGIWHASLDAARELAAEHGLVVERIHSHIGSGSDPEVWKRVAALTLDLARAFPKVETVNLGGGYKVARMPGEGATDLQRIGAPVRELFERFAAETGRRLRLEIEPGTFLVANAAAVLASVEDVVDTGAEGYRFIKLDTGMTEILRPSLYGAQHPIRVLRAREGAAERDYVVVGHCCESGDILTPAPGDPELLAPRPLPEARAGDLCLVGGAGAYCAAMSAKNYNSYPEAPEVLLCADGAARLIRRRQTLGQILENEISVE
ncbi:MAG: diaminopimelate decarboxylase [Opitutales bacterium]|nr:diaminopimelate decarboxylase [Opitutales bacterium]